jgi:L-xylulokinase
MPKYLLGTDNGGTVAKAALISLDGREVAVAGRKTEMLSPRPGHTERDVDCLWRATADSIRAVLAESHVPPEEVVCVACTGHGNGLYLVDKQGRPVRNGINSTDSRAKDYVARWYADGTHRAVLSATMQSLWPGQPNALLAWLRDHEPETMRKAGWALMCKDYIRFRLTGQFHGELTDMSGTSLVNVADGDYDMRVLEAFGLAGLRDLLPPIKRPEEILGEVTAQAAAETGLRPGTPVAGGLFDIDACALACGITDESQLSLIAGTWSINQFISRTPVIDEDLFMCSRYCIPGYYLVPEASATSASNLEWFVTQFMEPLAAMSPGAPAAAGPAGPRTSAFDLVNDLVARTSPEDAAIIFLPFLFGSNADPDAKACFLGLNGWHSRGHVLRAVQEGVVFGHKAHVDRLLRFRPPAGSIRLTGGAARSRVWQQMFADVFQVPVEIPSGTELGALGAAICAGVAAGCFANYEDAVRAMVRVADIRQPDPARRDVYVRKYDRYKLALEALGRVWKDLA